MLKPIIRSHFRVEPVGAQFAFVDSVSLQQAFLLKSEPLYEIVG
jgi:hypothetical protein